MPALRIDWLDITFPPAGALIWLVLSWSATLGINAGRPLSAIQRNLLKYGFFFALGMCYLIVLVFGLGLQHGVALVLIPAWGFLIFYVAWRRSHRKGTAAPGAAVKPRVPYLGAGLPTVALLVCLIGCLVEWSIIAKGSGRLWVGLLWSAGVVASVWLAGKYRHAVVRAALRALIALAVIGAIAERSLAVIIAAAVAGAALFVLQRLWKPPAPPITDLGALLEAERPGARGHESGRSG